MSSIPQEHEKDSAVEFQALMIPRPAVLAIVVGNHFSGATKDVESEKLASTI